MFAFAIWDEGNQRLVLARDRLGIKPLYYRVDGGRVAFASEIKGLLADPAVPRKLNHHALADYLTFQNIFGDKTFFEGIQVLPPGHVLIAETGRVEVREYWDLHFSERVPDEGEAVREFGALLDEAVEMQLMSDVPLGSHLSGGIDSGSIVMTAVKKLAERLKTFSVYFDEPAYDESAVIEEVSMMADSIHYEQLLNPSEFPDVLWSIAYHLDEPRVGPSVIPQWYVARLASKEVKVVLTGHGGDELFAGYPSYIIPYLKGIWNRRDGTEAFQILRTLRRRIAVEGWKRILGLPLYAFLARDLARYGRESVFNEAEQADLLTPRTRESIAGYNPRSQLDTVLDRCDARDPLNRALYLDIKTYLPSLLLVEDRISMAHSLEGRVPLLDHRIAELSAAVPGRFKIRDLTLKHIPRRHARGLLPKSALEQRKVGFLVPMAEWLRGPLRGFVEGTLLSPRSLERGLFRPERIRRLVERHMAGGRDLSAQLWVLLNIELWHRIWLDRDPSPSMLAARRRAKEAVT